MTTRMHLTVIPGGKNTTEEKTPQFSHAYATNTRLMGVVAVKAMETLPDGREVIHFFHLDFEEFGIDAYERVDTEEPETLQRMTQKMTGGLGGQLVRISPEELAFLIREAYALNLSRSEALPSEMEGLFSFLKAENHLESRQIHELWLRITPELATDTELVNYYLMRLWAGDVPGALFLSRTAATAEPFGTKPAVMVRNRVQFLKEAGGVRYYQAETLSDNDREYRVAACEVGVFEEGGQRRVFSASVQSTFKVSEVEAAFMLRRTEHLALYRVLDMDRVRLFFDLFKPDAMITLYEAGVLYTYFKADNAHVRESEYRLNDDVQCYYYLSEDDQLVVCALEGKNLRAAQLELELREMLSLLVFENEYVAETPILYDFIHSDYLDFQDFWDDYSE